MATKIVVSGEQEIVAQRHTNPRRTQTVLDYEVAFLGGCFGVALCRRGAGKAHHEPVTLLILVEDDGTWFTACESVMSSFWLPDLIEQLNAARMWLDDNAVKVQFGWAFK